MNSSANGEFFVIRKTDSGELLGASLPLNIHAVRPDMSPLGFGFGCKVPLVSRSVEGARENWLRYCRTEMHIIPRDSVTLPRVPWETRSRYIVNPGKPPPPAEIVPLRYTLPAHGETLDTEALLPDV